MRTQAIRIAGVLAIPLLLASCKVEIQHGLDEREANEILVLLERKGIPTTKEREEGGKEPTFKIAVAKSHATNAAMLLKENELPRTRNKGFEIFNKGSLIPTATEERAMYLQALSGELARTIGSIDGVLDARVHINIPQIDDLADRTGRPVPSASVLIKYRVQPDPERKAPPPAPVSEEQIQQLVSRAVQDLDPKNVSVVMTAAVLPGGIDPGPGLVDVVGIRMAADSVNMFRAMLGGLVLLVLLLAAYIVFSKGKELKPTPPRRAPRPGTEG